VKDIELIAIVPNVPVEEGTFGLCSYKRPTGFIKLINSFRHVRGQADVGLSINRILPKYNEIQLDFFVGTLFNFGYIYALRTGSQEFNRSVIIPYMKKNGDELKDGIHKRGEPIACETEKKLFRMMKIPYIPPIDRGEEKRWEPYLQ